jgi:galactofuranosylgalactofuranosylrhamnosyl-N-acetylglucosaminyl-diphospho-decaprenol beta-1,5/1,6-galactofuranosyltransferase
MNAPRDCAPIVVRQRLQSSIWPIGARAGIPEKLCFHARPRRGWVVEPDRGIRAIPNLAVSISLNTFFGAFSLSTWCGPAGLDDVVVEIGFRGHCTLKIFEDNGYEPPRLLHEQRVRSDGAALQVPLAGLRGRRGVLYPVLEVYAGDTLELHQVDYFTTTPPRYAPRLAIVMPTFRREEYARRNVERIAQEILGDGDCKLFVVDNARTLQLEPSEGVEVIGSGNFGGSGGFARGVLAAQAVGGFSHVLFCDDDILLEPQSIRRLRALLRYVPQDATVSGGMLKMGERSVLHEKNANVRHMLFSGNRIDHDLAEPELVARYDEGSAQTFSGWWFLCYPLATSGGALLPYPFFVGWDDVEMGHRVNRQRLPCLSLLGVAAWHEEFEKKDTTWRWYYHARNGLVTSMLYEDDASALSQVLLEIMTALLTYRYERAEFMIAGLAAAASGSASIRDVKADALHQSLVARQQVRLVDARAHVLPEKVRKKRKPWFLRKWMSRLTMNGHLLPRFLFRRGELPADPGWVVEELHSRRLVTIFRCPRVVYYEPTAGLGMLCEVDHARYFKLLARMLWQCLRLRLRWGKARAEWRRDHAEMVSAPFWKRQLGL